MQQRLKRLFAKNLKAEQIHFVYTHKQKNNLLKQTTAMEMVITTLLPLVSFYKSASTRYKYNFGVFHS